MPIYFDNAATSFPKPESVYKAVDYYLREIGASPGRGAYRRAAEAEKILYETRKLLGKLFNISDVQRIIFTANVTESLNLVLKGFLRPGDHVVTSAMEHNAVWRPLKVLEKEIGLRIMVISCKNGFAPSPDDIKAAVTTKTRLVSFIHASNVTGTLMPLKEIGKICRHKGVPFLVDAAQTAGAYPLDAVEDNISLLAFTGHKSLLAPTGTGGLYIAPDIELKPLKEGGTGADSIPENQPEKLPDRFEAGTINMAGISGLRAALDFILDNGLDRIRDYENELTAYALKKLNDIPGITIYGPQDADSRLPVISFNIKDIAAEEVAYVLDEVYEIMVRAGLHCSPQAHHTLGTLKGGTVRLSFGFFNTIEEIDSLCKALTQISAC